MGPGKGIAGSEEWPAEQGEAVLRGRAEAQVFQERVKRDGRGRGKEGRSEEREREQWNSLKFFLSPRFSFFFIFFFDSSCGASCVRRNGIEGERKKARGKASERAKESLFLLLLF